ncbi:MAG TPA: hypothetical protein VFQ54_12550 [Thermomicrobiales bacterium]|nr:hypothetical protein [Thermomicrobiales bacterium]
MKWAKVTAISPLRIQLDGETDPLTFTPRSLVAGLAVDDRVLTELVDKRRVIVGRLGG